MQEVDTGSEKVKKICDALRKETLEPAKREAEEILLDARKQAEAIVAEARKSIEKMHSEAHQEIERQKNIFQSSLHQACKQALFSLQQSIETKLFNQELSRLITGGMQSAEVIAQLVSAVVRAIEKEGSEANLSVYVPAQVSARSVNELLGKEIVDKLKEKSVLIGSMTGGIEVKLHEDNITIDVTDKALTELVASYIRKDFREMFFGIA